MRFNNNTVYLPVFAEERTISDPHPENTFHHLESAAAVAIIAISQSARVGRTENGSSSTVLT